MSYFPQRTGLGAFPTTAGFDYEAASKQAATKELETSNFALVLLGTGGANPQVKGYLDRELAVNAYQAFVKDPPAGVHYAAMWDDDGNLYESTFFGTVSVFESTFAKLKSWFPYLVAGGVIIGGALYFSKNDRRGRARRRVRSAIARARRGR